MNSITSWESISNESLAAPEQPSEPAATAAGSIGALKELVLRLLREVQGIAEITPQNLNAGLDFYDEVSRFEIDLIRRALLQTGGHQVQAAKLLNLKVTTLNSKIKHYNISPSGFAHLYPLVERGVIEERQHA
jgi:transcriptional regulator with GAF, ATPase, and Fis domain